MPTINNLLLFILPRFSFCCELIDVCSGLEGSCGKVIMSQFSTHRHQMELSMIMSIGQLVTCGY